MHRVVIVGVGLRRGEMTIDAAEVLASGARVLLRTERCDCAGYLTERGIDYSSLDALYEGAEDFDALRTRIVEAVLGAAEKSDVVYAVPDVRDGAAMEIMERADDVRLIPGVPIDAALWPHAQQPALALAASDVESVDFDSAQAALVREIDMRQVASDVKLALMDCYPAELVIWVAMPGGDVRCMPLCELDRLEDGSYGHDLAAFVPAVADLTALERYGFGQLNRVVRRLRAPDGCPWDIKQTHESIASNAVEEAYEVVDAIRANDLDALYDELGDLLLQVSLHAEIARQHGEFTIGDVTTAICRKLISRHEHIFGAAQASTPDEVLQIWERAKKKEKQLDTTADAMRAVTNSLPQLMRAAKVQKKAAGVGFDWDSAEDALAKVYEEADEVRAAIAAGSGQEEELGDLLFSCVNVARLVKLDPELALNGAVDKFVARFSAMEARILEDGRRLEDMTLAEMDRYWDEMKRIHVKE